MLAPVLKQNIIKKNLFLLKILKIWS